MTKTNMSPIKSICVYCGSKSGTDPIYAKAAQDLGAFIANSNRQLVYGAGSIGLMGIVARAALDAGGQVIGVIPEHLDAIEITQQDMTETHITNNMHERKKLMFDKSDAFIILPGGLGSMDEFFETLTWAQLQLHNKPIFLYNLNGYWDQLILLIDNIINEGFAHEKHKELFKVVCSLDELECEINKGCNEQKIGMSKFI